MYNLERSNGAAPDSLVGDLEGHLRVRLPEDYRAFLTQHNGGSPEPCEFFVPGYGQTLVNELYGLGFDDHRSLDRAIESRVNLFARTSTIPIGYDPGGNEILMGVAPQNYGTVYFFIHDQEAEIVEVAPSFAKFMEGLTDESAG